MLASVAGARRGKRRGIRAKREKPLRAALALRMPDFPIPLPLLAPATQATKMSVAYF